MNSEEIGKLEYYKVFINIVFVWISSWFWNWISWWQTGCINILLSWKVDIYGMSRLISNKLNGLFKKSTYEIKQLIFIKFFKVLAHI